MLTLDNFAFIDKELTLQKFMQKPHHLADSRSLAIYLIPSFNISIEKADILFNYLMTYKCTIGYKDSDGLYLYDGAGEWTGCNIDDAA